jgi:hypothetical protein
MPAQTSIMPDDTASKSDLFRLFVSISKNGNLPLKQTTVILSKNGRLDNKKVARGDF